ncbi:ankyrin, partial [Anaeromyces robustus]
MNLSLIQDYESEYLSLVLHIVLKTGNLEFVKYFLVNNNLKDPYLNINSCDINNKYPIITAYYDKGEIFEYLFNCGANYEINSKYNSLFLFSFAIDTNKYIQAKCLLKRRIVIKEKDIEGDFPLIKYVYNNNINQVKSYIKHGNKGNNVNLPSCGFTPLILSYILNYHEIFKILLEYSNINELDSHGNSILYYAVLKEDIPTINYLIEKGADINFKEKEDPYNFLLDISMFIKNKNIYSLLFNNPNISLNKSNRKGKIPLITMIKNDIFSLEDKLFYLKNLIERGSDVNFINPKNGKSPLIYAVKKKSLPMVKLLIQYGADVNHNNNMGYSSLCLSSRDDFFPIFKYLLENGADVNNEKGIAPLECALYYNSLPIVKLLIENGADPTYQVKRSLNMFETVLERNFDEDDKMTPKTESILINSLNKGYYCQNGNNRSELKNKRKSIIDYFVKYHFNCFNSKIINEIIFNNNLDILKLLVRNNLDIDIKDEYGNTPLAFAIIYGRNEIVDYLINMGANIYNTNNEDVTIYDYCSKYT